MEIILNGRKKEIQEAVSISELIDSLKLDQKTVVVELNEEVMKKDRLDQVKLKPNDRLEILHFVGGGWRKPKS